MPTAESITEQAMAALRESPESGAIFDPALFAQLRSELEAIPAGASFQECVAELAMFAVFLDQKLQARAASLELLGMLDQVCGPEAARLRAEVGVEGSDALEKAAQRFPTFMGDGATQPGFAPNATSNPGSGFQNVGSVVTLGDFARKDEE